MKNLEKYTEQQREWFRLNGLYILVKNQDGKERQDNLELFYRGLKAYKEKYKVKFDYTEIPK